ncbi:MAG: T9SS type A sorting domain-containing protein [Flavipsychrobacter sp.]|nr:T9SS type A sorting domain-containing protein [Flavipsychrobacter sp.]
MRSLSAIIILCCTFLTGYGQITLTATDYPGVLVGTDSLRQLSYTAPLPSLTPATGGSWDISAATDSSAALLSYRVAVPTYHFGDSGVGRISTFTFSQFRSNSVTSTGIFEYSMKANYAAYSLSSLTAAPFDSIFIPAQTSLYSTHLVKIAFPSTSGSAWQSVFSSDIVFELSISAFSLSHQQFTQRRFTVRKDTVVGWGTMRVKNSTGAPSPYVNVLQTQITTYTTDSFYTGSAVAPGAYLTLLGLTQGKKDTVYSQSYYRAGEITPLVSVQYKDAGFSTPSKVVYHHQRLEPVATENLSGSVRFAVYPNPANNTLHFVVPRSVPYQYTISDISGREVMSGRFDGSKGDATVSLLGFLLSGLYHVMVSENGVPEFTTQVVINR